MPLLTDLGVMGGCRDASYKSRPDLLFIIYSPPSFFH